MALKDLKLVAGGLPAELEQPGYSGYLLLPGWRRLCSAKYCQ